MLRHDGFAHSVLTCNVALLPDLESCGYIWVLFLNINDVFKEILWTFYSVPSENNKPPMRIKIFQYANIVFPRQDPDDWWLHRSGCLQGTLWAHRCYVRLMPARRQPHAQLSASTSGTGSHTNMGPPHAMTKCTGSQLWRLSHFNQAFPRASMFMLGMPSSWGLPPSGVTPDVFNTVMNRPVFVCSPACIAAMYPTGLGVRSAFVFRFGRSGSPNVIGTSPGLVRPII